MPNKRQCGEEMYRTKGSMVKDISNKSQCGEEYINKRQCGEEYIKQKAAL